MNTKNKLSLVKYTSSSPSYAYRQEFYSNGNKLNPLILGMINLICCKDSLHWIIYMLANYHALWFDLKFWPSIFFSWNLHNWKLRFWNIKESWRTRNTKIQMCYVSSPKNKYSRIKHNMCVHQNGKDIARTNTQYIFFSSQIFGQH